MAFDYFTIQALARELSSHLEGAVINQAHSVANQLSFSIQDSIWVYGVGGREGVLCLRKEPWPRDRGIGNGPEKYLVRARIVQVLAERKERIIRLRLERRDRSNRVSFGYLVCELVPNKVRFILHRENGGEILGDWGAPRGKSDIAKVYRPPDSAGRLLPGSDSADTWNDQFALTDLPLEKFARRWLAGADSTLIRELLFRVDKLDDKNQGMAIWDLASQLYSREIGFEAFHWNEAGKICFSALEPRRLKGAYQEFDSVSEAIWFSFQAERDLRQNQGQQRKLKGRLVRALKNGRRRLMALRTELETADQAEEYDKKGTALLANLAQVRTGQKQVELSDVFDPEGRSVLAIDLDPERTPADNAARYLKAAKKFRRRQEILPRRLAELEFQCARFEAWISAVEADAWEDLIELQDWLEDKVVQEEKKSRSGAPNAHPRRYRTSTGWSVWAGRNNKENDVLTHKMSAQNDMWFHAHGYPGSHVVLRREGRKEEPSKQTLEETAALAAHWSKGKTANKVSVVYTLVKYVTKPRGGNPGQALLRREKTLVVKPSLLDEDKDVI